jgi:hypothetical protein
MRTVSNYKALASVQGGEQAQLKHLAQAINLDLSLPQLCLDALGPAGSIGGRGVKSFAANEPRLSRSDCREAFKGALARKWAVPSDTPFLSDVAQRVESFWHTNMPELDTGWMQFFQLVDLRGTSQDTFDILDTNAGITWEQMKPGTAIKPRREISESRAQVGYLTYSAGLGLLDDWIRFQKFWNVEQAVAEFRATAWDKQAELHYGLFTALGAGVNQAFATNDTTTFNAAGAAILRNVRSKGYAAGQNARFKILCAPEHQGRILTMLEATQGSAIVANQAGVQPLAYAVDAVVASTFVAANSTGYYLVLPGRKLQRGNWLDLQIEGQRDVYARAQDWVGTQQFNAAIGDSDQVRRVLFS